jgi:hypothetical protein
MSLSEEGGRPRSLVLRPGKPTKGDEPVSQAACFPAGCSMCPPNWKRIAESSLF